jgi:energy-coupling factor transporter ATP-binding protein EcfA2
MQLWIKNFRAIREQELDIAPITVLYGMNGTGKSSILYALLTLKNIVLNPNQPVDAFFGYGFLGLGNFKAVVFDHNDREPIELGVSVTEVSEGEIRYFVRLNPSNGEFRFYSEPSFRLALSVAFPYPANAHEERGWDGFRVVWNGLLVQVEPTNITPETEERAEFLARRFNQPIELVRTTEIVPLRRGFSKPYYGAVSLSPLLVSEEEVATLLATDPYLLGKVSIYLERIVGHSLYYHAQLGTAIFTLNTVDRATGMTCELVNEGFGVNHLVFLLTKALRSDVRIVCIEEPEIHLHPSAQRKLAQTLVDIAKNENKHFIITTHSETFLMALLAEVARGRLAPEQLACYWAVKKGKEAQFERQQVNEQGQIEGGLASFMEGELEDLKAFFGME